MSRAKMLLFYVAIYFVTVFLTVIAGSYVICIIDGVYYNWSFALPRALKGSAFLGCMLAVLQYIMNGTPSRK